MDIYCEDDIDKSGIDTCKTYYDYFKENEAVD